MVWYGRRPIIQLWPPPHKSGYFSNRIFKYESTFRTHQTYEIVHQDCIFHLFETALQSARGLGLCLNVIEMVTELALECDRQFSCPVHTNSGNVICGFKNVWIRVDRVLDSVRFLDI